MTYNERGDASGHSSHATISACAAALPPHIITCDEAKLYMGLVFDIPDRHLEAMMAILGNAHSSGCRTFHRWEL